MERTSYIDIPVYSAYNKDSDQDYLDGSKHRYVLKFDSEHLPPSNVFWSITMYRLSGRLRLSDPIRRYLINSPMFSRLQRDNDGGMTIYLQRSSPGKDKESNWLPPPRGLFFVVIRLYWPLGEEMMYQFSEPSVKKTG